jgi:hypothetical protein
MVTRAVVGDEIDRPPQTRETPRSAIDLHRCAMVWWEQIRSRHHQNTLARGDGTKQRFEHPPGGPTGSQTQRIYFWIEHNHNDRQKLFQKWPIIR